MPLVFITHHLLWCDFHFYGQYLSIIWKESIIFIRRDFKILSTFRHINIFVFSFFESSRYIFEYEKISI